MKKLIGTMKCINPACGHPVHVQEAETGTLSYNCVPCDWSPYFKAGTTINRQMRERITPWPGLEETTSAPPKPDAPAPAPAPAQKRPASFVFAMGDD